MMRLSGSLATKVSLVVTGVHLCVTFVYLPNALCRANSAPSAKPGDE